MKFLKLLYNDRIYLYRVMQDNDVPTNLYVQYYVMTKSFSVMGTRSEGNIYIERRSIHIDGELEEMEILDKYYLETIELYLDDPNNYRVTLNPVFITEEERRVINHFKDFSDKSWELLSERSKERSKYTVILDPKIRTFEGAMEYIDIFGHPKIQLFDSTSMKTIVLSGGSIRHPIAISLIDAIVSGQNFGRHYSYKANRLVIKDDRYRTKYAIDEEQYNEIKDELIQFATKKQLPLKIMLDWRPQKELLKTALKMGFRSSIEFYQKNSEEKFKRINMELSELHKLLIETLEDGDIDPSVDISEES